MGMLLIGLVAVAIVGLIVIPNFASPHRVNPANACINNLRLIDACKQEWGVEHGRTNGPVSWEDIAPYLARLGEKPESIRCPGGGTYTLGKIEELPTCTIPKHSLNPALQ